MVEMKQRHNIFSYSENDNYRAIHRLYFLRIFEQKLRYGIEMYLLIVSSEQFLS